MLDAGSKDTKLAESGGWRFDRGGFLFFVRVKCRRRIFGCASGASRARCVHEHVRRLCSALRAPRAAAPFGRTGDDGGVPTTTVFGGWDATPWTSRSAAAAVAAARERRMLGIVVELPGVRGTRPGVCGDTGRADARRREALVGRDARGRRVARRRQVHLGVLVEELPRGDLRPWRLVVAVQVGLGRRELRRRRGPGRREARRRRGPRRRLGVGRQRDGRRGVAPRPRGRRRARGRVQRRRLVAPRRGRRRAKAIGASGASSVQRSVRNPACATRAVSESAAPDTASTSTGSSALRTVVARRAVRWIGGF